VRTVNDVIAAAPTSGTTRDENRREYLATAERPPIAGEQVSIRRIRLAENAR